MKCNTKDKKYICLKQKPCSQFHDLNRIDSHLVEWLIPLSDISNMAPLNDRCDISLLLN